jgi:hypothetical protein
MLVAACGGTQTKSNTEDQATATENQATVSPHMGTEQQNIQAYIQLIRSDVRQQKSEIMGSIMLLSADDAAKFWPIYEDYDAALNKLNDKRVANIKDYANSYDQMTDEKADELIKNAMAYRKQRSDLLEKTYGRMKQALGATTAARFVQVENQLLEIIDLKIAASLPVAGEES